MRLGFPTRFAAIAALFLAPFQAAALDTTARAALVVDHNTQTVLLSKNADMSLPPASMSKLMTLSMVFEALQSGRLSLTDEFRVSEKAWQMGGSKMFLRAGNEVSVQDLIRGVIVQSGNDACVVLAEGLAGSEAAFADRMTRRAREIGMNNSTFANSTGWPHPDHRMSAEDLVTLATHLIDQYPEYYGYFAERSFTWDGIDQDNRNPLLGLDVGADGLKTGHTEEAGYGLVGSAERDGRRITFMLTGLASAQARLVESERIVNWAFREFYTRTLFEKDSAISSADVWIGSAPTVTLAAAEDIRVVVPFEERENVETKVIYNGPIAAPIAKGDKLAELVVNVPTVGEQRIPLVAGESVEDGGFLTRFTASARILSGRLLDTANEMIN
ncbi:D-alanyl-D-alanine carboxypeptidase family protein [Algicella marina]|uniref:serine-type D-Ala-D-Ala carboxypeptidase n=1 Tax=Algicella marina TaxID=2683284 RepID=A0A6P1SZ46_9RHOB|nr:D-alanyl-D-alanine carboxypeptidase family protein [Algicella marina]QHQ34890.1 D-alanyl-D-alanine carboxypeptidase [Algicella marina]